MSEYDQRTPTVTDGQLARSTDPTPTDSSVDSDVSRRTVIKTTAMATGGLLAGAGISTTVAAQQTTFQLGGEVAGWQGQSPSSIEGQTNPTLELEAGQEYEIVWENLDGAPHNVVIEDANGNNLVRTDLMSDQGATQSVTFTASEEMAQYYCEVHPQSMRGDVSVSGGATATETTTETTTGTETETETATETATATETPTETTTATDTPTETTTGTPSGDEGPLMADEACPENGTDTPAHKTDTCAKDESKTGGDTEEDAFAQLLRLLIQLLQSLLGVQ